MANKSFIVEYLIKARDKYSAAADKIRSSSEAMRRSVVAARKSFSQFNDVGARAASTFKSIKKRMEGVAKAGEKIRNVGAVASAAITLPVGLMLNSMKNAARDAGETRSKFATVFKSISQESENAAVSLSRNFGLSSSESRQLLADTGDLLTGFGFTQKEALNLSTRVNELAVDLASFTNYQGGSKGASEALTKALLGEREQLKSLGVAISEENVKTKIAQMLAEGMQFKSLRQAKAHATLALAVEQSKNAIGDFARTQHELANQERITSARFKDLKESFGAILLPVALKITQAMRRLFEWLTDLSPAAKKIILIVGVVVAAIGPILLALGSVIMILPALTAGFAAFGVVAAAAMGPLGLIVLGLVAGAGLIIYHWQKLKDFFSGFATGVQLAVGPTITGLVDRFKEAAGIIAGLFGSDSEAAKSLTDFSNIGRLIGDIIGGALRVIINGLSGIGAIIGQVVGAITTFDFSQFDVAAIKAEFMGGTPPVAAVNSSVNVGVNVGLDQGLRQTAPATVTASGARRTDVGVN